MEVKSIDRQKRGKEKRKEQQKGKYTKRWTEGANGNCETKKGS